MAADVRSEIAGGGSASEDGDADPLAADGGVAALRFRDPARARDLAAALERLVREHRPRADLGDARLRQPRAGDRALRPARHLPARPRRHHGPGLPGLRHRRARGRRGGGARASRACASPPTATCCASRARPARSPTRRPRARTSTSSTASRRRSSWRARRPAEEVVFFATGFETTAVATAAVAAGRSAAELLGALGAQVHPAGDGDRRRDAGHTRRGLPRRRPRRDHHRLGRSSSRSSSATACRWWSPASSRSTSSPAW